jgi:hypothetical protein
MPSQAYGMRRQRILGSPSDGGVALSREGDGPIVMSLVSEPQPGVEQHAGQPIFSAAEATWVRDQLTYMLKPSRARRVQSVSPAE